MGRQKGQDLMADTTVTVIGNLTADPELRYTQNGTAVANFSVAVTPRVNRNGQWEDGETSFFRCSVWRDYAVNLADSLGKGARVIVTGTLKQRSWETPEGDARSTVEIDVQEVGPSLRWVTATINKAARNGGGKNANFEDEMPEEKPAHTSSTRSRASSGSRR
jgi:single-strand DNA-binding protein